MLGVMPYVVVLYCISKFADQVSQYLHRVLTLRGHQDDNVSIDSPANLLFMAANLRMCFDHGRTLAFVKVSQFYSSAFDLVLICLQTPNVALKSTEVPM